ncbi:MAG: hypothetical protein H6733_17590 [Alphaproteobacteria bacterium]|nr:hypothetical protein [Alphaproteobacteria bacterium]
MGLGGEIFDRVRGDDFGYRNKLRISTYWAVSGRFSSHMLQYDRRTRHEYFVRLLYRFWSDMIYVGSGGQAVATNQDPALSLGNRVAGPSLTVGGTFRLPDSPARIFAQLYGRFVQVDPAAGGILAIERPVGVNGGFYADASVGAALEEIDRWPLPNKGVRAEASVRGGFTATENRLLPIVGVNAELTAWFPLAGAWLVIGGRALFDKTWGERPFFEQEWLGGQARDELAYEQMLLGYGRTRTRGDGVIANAIELRAFTVRSRHPFWDVGLYFSAFAESAFVFDKGRAGPHLPTVGVGPVLLWQGAVTLRPWIGWGWLRDGTGEPRHPQSQVGLALSGPL